jgi:hypothetical protein
MKKTILSLLALHLGLLPCFADVIPSQYNEKSGAARDAVKTRLQELGRSSTDAEFSVKHLTPGELTYFSQNIERVQPAGGLYWYEWVGGLALLVIAVLAVSFYPWVEK